MRLPQPRIFCKRPALRTIKFDSEPGLCGAKSAVWPAGKVAILNRLWILREENYQSGLARRFLALGAPAWFS